MSRHHVYVLRAVMKNIWGEREREREREREIQQDPTKESERDPTRGSDLTR